MMTYQGHRVVGEHGNQNPQCPRCGIDRDRQLTYKYGPLCPDCRAVINNQPVYGKGARHARTAA